ncbi:hypothetical protein [uncultured Brachyspira sp.]|uniref:hypothetical protein n=1 Tax=uncultured Brachyspira sp. TaxID=221953 RepID=UPI0025E80785|nr:hypothetical protein [uncultured Brachyspira sp.]
MHNRKLCQNSKKKIYFELFSFMSNMTTRSLRRKTPTEESTQQQANLSPRPRRSVKRTVSASPVQVIAEAQENLKPQENGEVAELRKMVQELSKEKSGRKLSALNKFKKYVLSKSTEQALAETDFSDLIPVDKMRLLNKAYPIVWEEMVLKQLYKKYGCNTEEEQTKLRNKKNIQLEYQIIVDNIIDESKEGELDDQEHFREDITKILCYAIREAAKGFKNDDDDVESKDKKEDDKAEE